MNRVNFLTKNRSFFIKNKQILSENSFKIP